MNPLELSPEQLGDRLLRHRLADELCDAFPQCRVEVAELFRLLGSGQEPAGVDGVLNDEHVKHAKLDFLFCALRSFCPAEADAFLHCSESMHPTPGRSRPAVLLLREPPLPCRRLWQRFDQCLVRKTDEFARSQQENEGTK